MASKIDELLAIACSKGASDLHIKAGSFPFMRINGELQPIIEAGDLALIISKWTLKGTDPTGAAVDLAGQTADVVRRQADGSWLFVIDNPYGS